MSDAQDIVVRLRQERSATAWARGLDTDYPTAWEPNLLCHEAADAIAQLRYELDQTRHSLREAGADLVAERERCAKIAEEWGELSVADAIRGKSPAAKPPPLG